MSFLKINTTGPRQLTALALILLLALTLTAYLGVAKCGFITFDDPDYVTQNPYVKQGLTPASLQWAFTKFHSSNWHPLTWISHMVDVELFGLKPAGHHLHNLLLHSLNAALLFLLLCYCTNSGGKAFLVAALFALHPLHVESVAWVSERKDVLSTCFGLLCLLAYARFAQGKIKNEKIKSVWYGLALLCFALGLMSKPMLVTWPFVLLVLDIWPLRRIDLSTLNSQRSTLWRLVLEKLPFFILTALSCIITMRAQGTGRSVVSLEWLPLEVRFGNASAAVFDYLARTLVPTKLAVFYPFPEEVPWGKALMALALIVVLFGLALRRLKFDPALFVGLAWFVGTLIPVIGLVQVGMQASADRYTYIPHIGLFIATVWGIGGSTAALRCKRVLPAAISSLALAGCWLLTAKQVQVWRSDLTLFEHAKNVTERNYIAMTIYGKQLADQGQNEAALACYDVVRQIQPRYALGHYVTAEAYRNMGRTNDALAGYSMAIQLDPHHAESFNSRGALLTSLSRVTEAKDDFRRAIELMPSFVLPHLNLGIVLQHEGRYSEAAASFRNYLTLEPGSIRALSLLGDAEFRLGNFAAASSAYEKALQLDPFHAGANFGLGCVYIATARFSDAEALLANLTAREPKMAEAYFQLSIAQTALDRKSDAIGNLRHAVGLKPVSALYHYHLAAVLTQAGSKFEAIQHYNQTLELDPNFIEALNNLAWLLATDPDPSIQNPERAVSLAIKACELTNQKEALLVGTLAAAYAAAERFPEAIATAECAIELATAAGQSEVAARNEELLNLYRAGQPYREAVPEN
jgi:tetratricopeptide (TPR) repeat protein